MQVTLSEALCDAILTGVRLIRYGVNAKQYFEDYLPGPKRTVFHTKKGLSWRNAWGVLRYAANNAFIAFVHAAQMKEQARPLRPYACPVLLFRPPRIACLASSKQDTDVSFYLWTLRSS